MSRFYSPPPYRPGDNFNPEKAKGHPATLTNEKGDLVAEKVMQSRTGAKWGIMRNGAWHRLHKSPLKTKKQRVKARRMAREAGAL